MLGTAGEWKRLDRSRVYFNSAGRTPLPLCAARVGEAALPRKASTPWEIGDTAADRDAVRALFARLLGTEVEPSEVAIVPSTSYAMSLAARALSARLTRSRPAVLVLRGQNPSNVMAWQALCEERQGELAIVAADGAGGDWTAAVLSRLAVGDVAVCAVPPAHWCDGALLDLHAVGDGCRAVDMGTIFHVTGW